MIYDKGKVRVPEHSRVRGWAERGGGRVAWLHYLGKFLSSMWLYFHARIHPTRNITFYTNTSHHNLSIFFTPACLWQSLSDIDDLELGERKKKISANMLILRKEAQLAPPSLKLRGELLKSRLDLQVWTWLLLFQMNYCTLTVALSRERLSQQQWKTCREASKKTM